MLINAIVICISVGNGVNTKCVTIVKDFFGGVFEGMFETGIQ